MSSSTDTSIEVYSLGISNEALSIPTIESSKQHIWSPLSGNQLFSHSTSNIVRTYDPRTSKDAQLELNSAFQINRPSYSALLDDVSLIATGTIPSTRSRSLKLYDLRLPSQPKAIIPFDPASSPSIALVPLVDISRRLAYLIQLHSSSIFAFDFNETNPLPTTLQLPSTIVGATLLPSTQVDVMRAEINRAFVLTRRDEIVPVSVRIERKVDSFIVTKTNGRPIWIFIKIYFRMCSYPCRHLVRVSGSVEVIKYERKCPWIRRSGDG